MDKVLYNVEAILAGKRMKFLDPQRKAVLLLPLAAFKLWHTYWMFENDEQEAYPRMETLIAVSGMSENTILKARKYLLETGWLVQLTGSAAGRYSKPTNGAWKIGVYRVNDPTAKAEVDETYQPQNLRSIAESAPIDGIGVQKMNPPKSAPNVSVAFAVASTGTILSPSTTGTATIPCKRVMVSDHTSLRSDEKQKQQQKQKPRPVQPPNTAPPPKPKFSCPVCEFSHHYGSEVADHIEKEHPELGQQSFPIDCPLKDDNCRWRVWWNKVADNKADRDAMLVEHLEMQHNPESPKYNPWFHCNDCDRVFQGTTHACKKAKTTA